MIDIVNMLLKNNKSNKIKLLIAGEIIDRNYFYYLKKKIIKLKLSNNIKFVKFTDIKYFFSRIDFLISARDDEAFGRTLVESYLYKIPYFVTNMAGHKEIHKMLDGGILYTKNHKNSLIINFNRLISKQYIREYYYKHDINKVEKNFGENQHKLILNLYKYL